MRSRTATALVGLLLSLVLSGIGWWYFDTLLFFLFVPFIPILFRRESDEGKPKMRECPTCGFRTTEPGYDYCPRDGTELTEN
ncbi:MAG: hypothetical protein ABEJ48_04190 [Halobacteriales archaeon]